MTAKKVFVTGAGGQTGTNVVKWLAQQSGLEVCAGIHKGEESAQQSLFKTLPIKPHVIEATDYKQLVENFRDVQDLFIIPPSTPDKVSHACNYIKAAKEAGVKFVLVLSVIGADREDYSWGKQFKEIEECAVNQGFEGWSILRTTFYAQNLKLYKTQIKQGVLPLPTGDGKFAPLDIADISDAAGKILVDCKAHKNKIYELAGPEALNGREMAMIFSKVLDRRVEFKDINVEEARKILETQNVPDVEIQGLLDFYKLARSNVWDKVPTDYHNIVGRPPTGLHDFISRNKEELLM